MCPFVFIVFRPMTARNAAKLAALGRQPQGGRGGGMIRCWKIYSSGGAALRMFFIIFLDAIVVILSLNTPRFDDAAMRFGNTARDA